MKGGEYEREISKFLTVWLTGNEKPYMFWRQDASGGLATVHIENEHMTGDIKSLHPDSKFFTDVFSIECKTGYPKTSFWQFFTTAKFNIKEFWLQANEDASKSNKNPMLIYRKLGRKSIIGINRYIQECLFYRIMDLDYLVLSWRDMDSCILYNLESFFSLVRPEDVRGILDFIERKEMEL